MRKSILLIDTPESCNECILSGEYIYCTGEIISGENICHGCRGHNYDSAKKPDWCPLQVVPEKMEVCGRYPQPDGIAPSYKIGWNKCIDKILKNKERWLKWENGKEWGEIQCPMLNDGTGGICTDRYYAALKELQYKNQELYEADLQQAQARKQEREKHIQQLCRNVSAINIIEQIE